MGYKIINDDGVIIDELREGDRIVRKSSLDHLHNEVNKVGTPKDEEFIKMFRDALPQLASIGLSVAESRVFFFLLDNVRYESNVAKYGNGTLITREHISEELKLDISNINRSVIKLCDKGLIAIAKIDIGKVFIVNPFVAMRGKTIDKTTYDLFKKTKWARDWSMMMKN